VQRGVRRLVDGRIPVVVVELRTEIRRFWWGDTGCFNHEEVRELGGVIVSRVTFEPVQDWMVALAIEMPGQTLKASLVKRGGEHGSIVGKLMTPGVESSIQRQAVLGCFQVMLPVGKLNRCARAPRKSIPEPRPPQRQTCRWSASRDNDRSRMTASKDLESSQGTAC